ncbi:MAG: transposase [Blastocatellia bacterium]
MYRSEIGIKWKERFNKNREKLVTFLDYNGVPWNNNNAEHAVKAFVRLRRVIGGSRTEKGIRDYLMIFAWASRICVACSGLGARDQSS